MHELLVLGLGTARLTGLITRDSILARPRDILFTLFPPENNKRLGWEYQNLIRSTRDEQERGLTIGKRWPYKRYIDTDEPTRPPTFLGELIGCPYCISVWIAIANCLAFWQWPHAVLSVNYVLVVAWLGAVAAVKGGWK